MTKRWQLTVNSPVTASNPTCMVCSKSDGGEISGRSLSLSFFLPPESKHILIDNNTKITSKLHIFFWCQMFCLTFFSPREDWEDLVARCLLLRYRRQRFRAVVGWKWVFARATTEDCAAHSDWRGRGFILRVTVITHRYEVVVSRARLTGPGNTVGEDGEGGKPRAAITSAHVCTCATGRCAESDSRRECTRYLKERHARHKYIW